MPIIREGRDIADPGRTSSLLTLSARALPPERHFPMERTRTLARSDRSGHPGGDPPREGPNPQWNRNGQRRKSDDLGLRQAESHDLVGAGERQSESLQAVEDNVDQEKRPVGPLSPAD